MFYTAIVDLTKNPDNPRVVKDEGFQKLKESLQSERGREFFEARPIICSKREGDKVVIIAGNTRYQAAKDLGWTEVPVVVMDGLTKEQEEEIITRDNVQNGEWDWDKLFNEWDTEKLEEWGLDLPEWTTAEEQEEENIQEKKHMLTLTFPTEEDKMNALMEIEKVMVRYVGATITYT